MAHNSTVLAQFLKLVPRHEFESLAKRHHKGRKLRSMTRWNQFVAMSVAQLAGRCSLRDIVSNLSAQGRKLYHLGVGSVARSSLARVNGEQPHGLYEELFGRLLSRCRAGRAGPRLPVPQPALLARRDDHRPVPVAVPVGEVPAREGRGEAAPRPGPRRPPAGVRLRDGRPGGGHRGGAQGCACRSAASSRRIGPTWTSTGSTA